jgi:hypothetical protein
MRTLTILAVLAAALVSSGCASNATSSSKTSQVESQPRFVPKAIPTLTDQERLLLAGNGYAVGTWAQKCGDASAINDRYYQDGKKLLSEVRDAGKLVRRSEFYDVTQVSKGVIRFKNYGKDFAADQEFVSETKTGFVGNKRMVFDQSVVFLGGQTAGEQLVLIKDGYEMSGSGGSITKGKRAPVMIRCQ